MKIDPMSMVGFEAIEYQKDGYLDKLANIVRAYKNGALEVDELASRLSESIWERFNLKCKVEIQRTSKLDAGMSSFSLNENSGILAHLPDELKWATKRRNSRVARAIAKGNLESTGWIDYKNAKLGGLFTKLECLLDISTGQIDHGSPEEVAAVLLHEIGHQFTYYEMIGVTTYRNVIIANRVNEILETKKKEERVKILIEENNVWGLSVDPVQLADLNDEDLTKVMIGSYYKQFKYGQGYVAYDSNTVEVLADQFAVRFGAAKYLSSELFKYYKNYLSNASQNTTIASYLFSFGVYGASIAIAASIAAHLTFIPIFLTLMFTAQFTGYLLGYKEEILNDNYDKPKDRLKRILQEEINRIKNANIAKEELAVILDNIAVIQRLVDKAPVVSNLSTALLRWFSSDYRDQVAKREYQQMMEEMLSNNLYVAAGQIKTLQ